MERLGNESSDCLMMQSEIVCDRLMYARASSAAAWLVDTQKTNPKISDSFFTTISNYSKPVIYAGI